MVGSIAGQSVTAFSTILRFALRSNAFGNLGCHGLFSSLAVATVTPAFRVSICVALVTLVLFFYMRWDAVFSR